MKSSKTMWDYNVAPTTIQPIIRNNRDTNERELVSLRWGLIPLFTKDIKEVKGTRHFGDARCKV